MSYNGSGTFVINSTGQPVVTGTVISSTAFNALTADLGTGLSTAITKDGQTATTARIPFAQGISSTLVTDSTSTTTGSIITAGGVGIAKALYVGTTANFGGVATYSAQPIFSSLTASSAVATDASKGLVSVTNTGTGNNVLATSPTLVTPILGTPSSGSLVNCTDTNYTGFKNRIINGAMVIDQRNAGASVTPTDGQYTLDRWRAGASAASKFSIQQSSTAPVGFNFSMLATSLSAYSVGVNDNFEMFQFIEGFNSADFGWGTANAQTVTLSFWVRSSLTGTFGGSIQNSAFNRSYPFSYTISSANTWEQKSITIAGDTSGTWIGATNGTGIVLCIGLGAGTSRSGTAGAWAGATYYNATGATSVVGTNGATFYITGVQLEKGSTATSFDYRPYGTELALCQRYYQRATAESVYATFITGVICSGTTSGNGGFQLMSPMRGTPTLDNSSASTFAYSDGSGGATCTSISIASAQSNSRMVAINFGTAGGLTQFRTYRIEANNSTTAFLGFSAEL